MTFQTQTIRAAAAALILGAAGLTAGHAAAKNHDCQAFRFPVGAALAQHDRAPGPALRAPN